mmetsp:Transcript_57947/g.136347  ORF Transcript_57947/g.136347 Transcript_57947/m.136347 type:complete len:257 (+) Transcript_57947:142-912(+)
MVDEDFLEPLHLGIVDSHLVRCELGISEYSRAEPNQQRLVSDLAHELRRGLVVLPEVHVEVGLVGFELVKTLQVVVAADDFVRHTEGPEEFGRQLVALSGAREKLSRLIGTHRLRLAEITEGDHCHVAVGVEALLEGGKELVPTSLVILHLPGVNVQVPEHPDHELRRLLHSHGQAGRAPVLLTGTLGPEAGGAGTDYARGENLRVCPRRGEHRPPLCAPGKHGRAERRTRSSQQRRQRQRYQHSQAQRLTHLHSL